MYRQTSQRSVNFSHVRRKPLSVKFWLTGVVDFGDFALFHQFLNPTMNRFVRDVGHFLLVERVVELPVKTTTVAHESHQAFRIGWDGRFVGVKRIELFPGQLGSQGTGTQQTLENGGVDVLDQKRTSFHGHQVFKCRHEQRHAEP